MKEESRNPKIAALNRIAFERHLRLQKFPEQAPGNGDNDKPDQFRCFLGLDCKELPLHPYRLMDYHKKEGWRWGESEDASQRFIVDKATDASASTQRPLPCKASARNVCLEGVGDRRPIFETLEKGLAKLTDAVGLGAAKAADTLFMFSLSGGDGGQGERRHVFALLTLPCYSPKGAEIRRRRIGRRELAGHPLRFRCAADPVLGSIAEQGMLDHRHLPADRRSHKLGVGAAVVGAWQSASLPLEL